MSLQVQTGFEIPAETQRVARAAFPKGTLCLRIADALGALYQNEQFAELFPTRGQPAEAPARLALATVLQFVEGLSDGGQRTQCGAASIGSMRWAWNSPTRALITRS